MKKNNIRKPRYLVVLERKIKNYCNIIFQTENRTPTYEELCKKFNIIEKILINCIRDYSTSSLNEKVGEDNEDELGDFIGDSNNFKLELESNEIYKLIYEEMEKLLYPRTIEMIIRRLGLYDGDKWTFDKLAKEYNCTKQNVHRKLEEAYKKLRKSKNIQKIYNID